MAKTELRPDLPGPLQTALQDSPGLSVHPALISLSKLYLPSESTHASVLSLHQRSISSLRASLPNTHICYGIHCTVLAVCCHVSLEWMVFVGKCMVLASSAYSHHVAQCLAHSRSQKMFLERVNE